MSKSIFTKIKHEIIKIWILSFYFSIFFIAISFFRFAILKQAEVPYTDFGIGVVKAFICAKFLLISQAIYPIKLNDGKPIILHILGRSLLYVLIVTILVAIEEFIMAKIHGHSVINAITGLRPGSMTVFFALDILYWLMVVPYVVFSVMMQSLGLDSFKNVFLGKQKINQV